MYYLSSIKDTEIINYSTYTSNFIYLLTINVVNLEIISYKIIY